MSSTPKWYCRNKSQPLYAFGELTKLGQDLRCITKRLIIEIKLDIFNDEDCRLLDDCEQIMLTYWQLKNDAKNIDFQSLNKKVKRSPYTGLLKRKFFYLIQLNDRCFAQLIFILKKIISLLLRKSLQSEIWLSWALRMIQLYNKYRIPINDSSNELERKSLHVEDLNVNICSNTYPALLLPSKIIDFNFIMQLAFQQHIEQSSLDLIMSSFNINGEWDTYEKIDSNCSSLEIVRILTSNQIIENDLLINEIDSNMNDYIKSNFIRPQSMKNTMNNFGRNKQIQYFLHNERIFMKQFIEKAYDISPSIFDIPVNKQLCQLDDFVWRGIHLMWSNVSIILDHILLWWIDNPISCYPLIHIDSIRNCFQSQKIEDIQEPIYSTLQGVAEIFTNFVTNNLWDHLFRYTLISEQIGEDTMKQFLLTSKNIRISNFEFGTATGSVWFTMLNDLVNFSNSYFLNGNLDLSNHTLLPISEQIPVLHRIDHSIHCLRLWVKEETKKLCSNWNMERFFKILEYDVEYCLQSLIQLKLPSITIGLNDVLMSVCIALRTKLICEINENQLKLKKINEECVEVLADVCCLLSLANFTLCFPVASYWKKKTYSSTSNMRIDYVSYILKEIYMPCITATKDINILQLILKIICEAWLDHIYEHRVHFSVNGALQLLNDFDQVRDWLIKCPVEILDQEHCEKLCKHEVLRMCKGVGKILLRKPKDVISIKQSPQINRNLSKSKDSAETLVSETQLPSEMFVSNQKHWLQLRSSKRLLNIRPVCCSDSSI